MAIGWHRPTRLRIDTTAITTNVANERKRLAEETELFAVVKANGYGHGAVETAFAARRGGATGFCVALVDEAIELREAGISEPILILGVVNVYDLALILRYELSVTVASQEWLEEAQLFLEQQQIKQSLQVHLKVDTGMGRIGFLTPGSVKAAVELLQTSEYMEWEGLFTHFATADQSETTYFDTQNERFEAVLRELDIRPKYVHVSNSATALWHGEKNKSLIRFGVAMYGLNPSGGVLESAVELVPALSLTTELIHVKQLPKGSGVGYGKTYDTLEMEWIGTLPIGYADGWLRKLQGATVLVNGQRCEIVGRICMDQCMIRLPEKIAVGTPVTLVGKDQQDEITLQDLANQLETIHYEVACTFSARIPREYTE